MQINVTCNIDRLWLECNIKIPVMYSITTESLIHMMHASNTINTSHTSLAFTYITTGIGGTYHADFFFKDTTKFEVYVDKKHAYYVIYLSMVKHFSITFYVHV